MPVDPFVIQTAAERIRRRYGSDPAIPDSELVAAYRAKRLPEMGDEEFSASVLESSAQTVDSTAPPPRGPLDPLTPRSPLGASLSWLQRNTPEFIKRPASAVARGFAERLSSGSAALIEPFAPAIQSIDQAMKEKYAQATGQPAPEPLPAYPRMGSVPDQLRQVGEAFAFGKSPVEGVDDPRLAMDELTRRTIGDYHALTPEQADAISRVSLGLPTGEVARSLLGTEGIALAGMTPAARMMDAATAIPFEVGKAGLNRVPFLATRKAVKESKVRGIREMEAQQAEQQIDLERLKKATERAAKQQGETFDVVDRRIREARMMPKAQGGVALTPEEQAIMAGYEQFGQSQVAQNVAAGLRPGVKGAHIEKLRRDALAGRAGAIDRLNEKLKPSGIRVSTQQDLADLPSQLAGYAPQVITESARDIKRIEQMKPTGRAPISSGKGFSASQVERILGDRTKTAAMKEAEFAAKHPQAVEPLFKGHFESALIRGDKAAQRRGSKLFLDEIGRRIGKPVSQAPKGWVRLTELPMGKSGITKAELARLSDIAIPEMGYKMAASALKVIRDPNLGEAKHIVESGFRAWKTYVLLRTGFTIRNALDNIIAVWAGGGRADYAEWAAKAVAYSTGKADRYGSQVIPGLGITVKEYVQSARRTGELAGGFAQDIPKIASGKNFLERKVLNPFRDANVANENFSRALLGMSKRAEGFSPHEAGAWTDVMLGRYGRRFQGPTHQFINTYIFPWSNWMVQIAKRSGVLATRFPGRIGQAAEAITEINRGQGFTPAEVEALGPDVKESGAIVRRLPDNLQVQPGDVSVFPTTFYGPTDINRMVGSRELGPLALLANPANQSYPPVQWLLAAGGLDAYRAKPFRGVDTELPSTQAATLYMRYPKLAQDLGIRPITENGKTRWMGPDKLAFIMRQTGPIGMALSDIGSADPDAVKRARAFFTGLSETIRNPQTSEMIDALREKNAIREQKGTVRSSARAEERLREEMRRAR